MKIQTIAQARKYRAKIEAAAAHLLDVDALQSIDLFPAWSGEQVYRIGDRCRYNGVLYRCYNSIAANPTWTPDITSANWEVVTEDQSGTRDDPITAAVGMRYFKGLYYVEGNALFLCIRDDTIGEGTILQYLPSQLISIYFEAVE